MLQYYELIKDSKPKNMAKKFRFDSAQQIYFASCSNREHIEFLGLRFGMLLDLADGNRSLEEIAEAMAVAFHVPEETIKVDIVNAVRSLQRKHLLYMEVLERR